ncbi:MAG: hypothetical protein KBD01_17790, partial [Acidobacteria bacterium]|nr:hypothetical protein [Acidobacteriota bacterium]
MSAAAGPELVRDVPLLGGDARGLLVIDRLVGGESFGGLRFAPGTSLDELAACARTMTLKHAFVRYPVGGAKAALDLPRGAEPAARRAALREFGAALAPLLHAGTYRAGIDMDCAPDDLAAFHAGAGLHADFSGWKNVSHVYTAW